MASHPAIDPIIVMGAGEAAYHAIQTLHRQGIPKEQILWLHNGRKAVGGSKLEAQLLLVGLSEQRILRAATARDLCADDPETAHAAIRQHIKEAQEEDQKKLDALKQITTEMTYDEEAKILDAETISIDGAKTKFKKIIVAESRQTKIPEEYNEHAGQETFLTSQSSLDLLTDTKKSLPESITIIGEDQHAIQWALLYARLGTRVTLIIKETHFAHMSRAENDKLKKTLLSAGITLVTNANIVNSSIHEGMYYIYGEGDVEMGSPSEIETETSGVTLSDTLPPSSHLMISTPGQIRLLPFFNDPALLELDPLLVDMESDVALLEKDLSLPRANNIFLAGSLIAEIPGRRISRKEATALSRRTGMIAALNACRTEESPPVEFSMPNAWPLSNNADPEYAWAGYSYEQAKKKFPKSEGYKIVRTTMKFDAQHVPVASVNAHSNSPYGDCFVTFVTLHKGKTRRPIGVEMLAPNAGLAIQDVTPYINDANMSVDDLANVIKICPTSNEAIKACAEPKKSHTQIKKPDPKSEPVVVIGAGLSGYSAALKLAKEGKRVILVEQNEQLGGASVDTFSSKIALFNARRLRATILEFAKSLSGESEAERMQKILFEATVRQIDDLISREDKKLRAELKALGIEVITGTAKIIDPHTVTVDSLEESIHCSDIIVSTGGKPFIPPPYQDIAKNPNCWTSTEAVRATEKPKSLTIIGGGVIGCEAALSWARMGVDVTIVSRETLLGYAEPEASQALEEILVRAGVRVITDAKDAGVTTDVIDDGDKDTPPLFHLKAKGKLTIYDPEEGFSYDSTGQLDHMETDIDLQSTHVLITCGRRSNAEELFYIEWPKVLHAKDNTLFYLKEILEKPEAEWPEILFGKDDEEFRVKDIIASPKGKWPEGIPRNIVTPNGSQIQVDEHLRSIADGCESIYSGGCCSTSPEFDLVPTTRGVGEVIAHNTTHPHDQKSPNPCPTPSAVFLDPEYGSVGKTLQTARNDAKVPSFEKEFSENFQPLVALPAIEDELNYFLKIEYNKYGQIQAVTVTHEIEKGKKATYLRVAPENLNILKPFCSYKKPGERVNLKMQNNCLVGLSAYDGREITTFGKTEEELDREANIESHVLHITPELMPIVNIESRGDYHGCFVKIVTENDIVVGATMVGPTASNAIQFMTYFIQNKKTIMDLWQAPFLDLSMGEAFSLCAEKFSLVQRNLGLKPLPAKTPPLRSFLGSKRELYRQMRKLPRSTSQGCLAAMFSPKRKSPISRTPTPSTQESTSPTPFKSAFG